MFSLLFPPKENGPFPNSGKYRDFPLLMIPCSLLKTLGLIDEIPDNTDAVEEAEEPTETKKTKNRKSTKKAKRQEA